MSSTQKGQLARRGNPPIPLSAAAAQLGARSSAIVNTALASNINLFVSQSGWPINGVLEDMGFDEPVLLHPDEVPGLPGPPFLLPPGLVQLLPRQVDELREGAVYMRDVVHAESGIHARLTKPRWITLDDVVIAADDWARFMASDAAAELRKMSSTTATVENGTATTSSSKRDAERLTLGADAMLTVRRAAELLPGDDKANRQIILTSGIVRSHGGRKLVRWGDVLDLFPTAAEQVETDRLEREREIRQELDTQPRRKPRRRLGGGFPLADL